MRKLLAQVQTIPFGRRVPGTLCKLGSVNLRKTSSVLNAEQSEDFSGTAANVGGPNDREYISFWFVDLSVLLPDLCASVFQNPAYEFRYQLWNSNDAI